MNLPGFRMTINGRRSEKAVLQLLSGTCTSARSGFHESRPPAEATECRTGILHAQRAFTLMEVMVAGGILFICLFSILALVSNGLRNARALQKIPVNPAGKLAAEASLNLKLAEGSDSGDFGDLYPDYRWNSKTNAIDTNSLFQVDFVIYRRSGSRSVESHMSILLYRPDSPRTSVGGAS